MHTESVASSYANAPKKTSCISLGGTRTRPGPREANDLLSGRRGSRRSHGGNPAGPSLTLITPKLMSIQIPSRIAGEGPPRFLSGYACPHGNQRGGAAKVDADRRFCYPRGGTRNKGGQVVSNGAQVVSGLTRACHFHTRKTPSKPRFWMGWPVELRPGTIDWYLPLH
jgi:hypothetical protein